ncbi:MAG: ABC transporter permease [Tepidisphaeraceae bacterium]
MFKYIWHRLIQFPLILAVIYLFTFTMVWIIPGDPFSGDTRKLSPEELNRVKRELHADTWYNFLGHYTTNLVTRGDFGPSLQRPAFSVGELVGPRLWVSARLGTAALLIAVPLGMAIGTLAAVKRNGPIDWIGSAVTMIGISFPSFVIASILMLVFVTKLRWFNIGEIDSIDDFILPSLALSLAPMAYIVRLQRSSMLDVLGADYVRTARAKGLSRWKAVVKHCLRNAFLPVLTYLGPAAAATLTGSFVVETIFDIQGLGKEFVNSITSRDSTLILALVMIYSTLLLSLNLVVDVLYAVVDPRIDVTGGAK